MSEQMPSRSVIQPVADRIDGFYCDLYGGARYVDCQCGASTHCRRSLRWRRGKHLGSDQLSRSERGRSSFVRMDSRPYRTEDVLHALRGTVYGEFVPVRDCSIITTAHLLSRSSGNWRRRARSKRAVPPRGETFFKSQRSAVWPLRFTAWAIFSLWLSVPTLGGFITDLYSWRWIFYINIPFGIVSLLLTNRIVERRISAEEGDATTGAVRTYRLRRGIAGGDWPGILSGGSR